MEEQVLTRLRDQVGPIMLGTVFLVRWRGCVRSLPYRLCCINFSGHNL
jgi:hypothetical protein